MPTTSPVAMARCPRCDGCSCVWPWPPAATASPKKRRPRTSPMPSPSSRASASPGSSTSTPGVVGAGVARAGHLRRMNHGCTSTQTAGEEDDEREPAHWFRIRAPVANTPRVPLFAGALHVSQRHARTREALFRVGRTTASSSTRSRPAHRRRGLPGMDGRARRSRASCRRVRSRRRAAHRRW